jgi:predicted Zn-dependent protease
MKILSLIKIHISEILNFVFGEANLEGQVAAIYLPRLRLEFYDLGFIYINTL